MNGSGSNTENSGDGGSDGWWELQGTSGRGRIENGMLANPLPCFYKRFWGSRTVFPSIFSLMVANLAQLALLYPKNLKLLLIKLINTNNIII